MYDLIDLRTGFVLVSKHPGIPFHKGSAPIGLVEKIRGDLTLGELYPVHRLDSMTSGVLLFARTRDGARELAGAFGSGTVEKLYLSLGDTHPKKKQGLIKGDMIRSRRGVWILARTMVNPAVTQFWSTGLGNGLRLYLVRPYTGRTHQIRVALKSIGAPPLGDPLYAANHYPGIKADRGYLHAWTIGFEFGGKKYCYKDFPRIGEHFQTPEFKAGLARLEILNQAEFPDSFSSY